MSRSCPDSASWVLVLVGFSACGSSDSAPAEFVVDVEVHFAAGPGSMGVQVYWDDDAPPAPQVVDFGAVAR